MFTIYYSEKAEKQLKKIAKGNKNDAVKILKAIEQYAEFPEMKRNIKVLKGKYGDLKRLRVGNYRIIFDNENNVLFVYEIKQRKDAYND